jgi:trimeric autotransporter adhesin
LTAPPGRHHPPHATNLVGPRDPAGSRDHADNSASESGAVYVFRRSGTQWQQEAYLEASHTDPSDQFGYGVALAGDTLAVGAPYEDSAATGVHGNHDDNSAAGSGAVYIFH